MKISVIIAVYNEEDVIGNCLASLAKQTFAKDMEVIVIDDGSTDNTRSIVSSQKSVVLLQQSHKGPGSARNLGASHAKGEILVFIDADMEFEADFIEKLVAPILASPTLGGRDGILGTFSKEEYLLNRENFWARYWNLNLGRKADRMLPENYPDTAPVFRAILRSKFEQAGGFDTHVGYTDDWTVSQKLGVLATAAPGAKFYHRNPETLSEVWTQARWFGKNEFLTRNLVRKFYNLLRYCPFWAIFKIYDHRFFVFKLVYNTAVFTSVILSFFGEQKSK